MPRNEVECKIRERKAQAEATERTAFIRSLCSEGVSPEVIEQLEKTKQVEAMAKGNVRYVPWGAEGTFQHADVTQLMASMMANNARQE